MASNTDVNSESTRAVEPSPSMPAVRPRYRERMRDDDDWVGTPPEGRHSRDRADPGFWQNQWQPAAAGAVLFVLVVIVLLLALL